MTYMEVIDFILKHITHRFGIPRTLTTDQRASFMSKKVKSFAESYGVKLLCSSPYYTQANGQAESSNKTLLKLVRRILKNTQRSGMRCFPKHCERIGYLY